MAFNGRCGEVRWQRETFKKCREVLKRGEKMLKVDEKALKGKMR